MPQPKQWMYVLSFLFVVYLIIQAPDQSGNAAKSFFGFWGNVADSAVTFIDNLADNDNSSETFGSDNDTPTQTTFGGFNTGDSFGPASN